jgi:hypothetical protein
MPWRQSTPQPPALNAVGGRVFQRKTRARVCRTRGGSGPPPRRYVGSTGVGGPDGREEVPDPYGGPRPRLLVRRSPFSGTRGVSGPVPERGAGPEPLAW